MKSLKNVLFSPQKSQEQSGLAFQQQEDNRYRGTLGTLSGHKPSTFLKRQLLKPCTSRVSPVTNRKNDPPALKQNNHFSICAKKNQHMYIVH